MSMARARPRTSRPEHLIWALLLFSVENINASLIGISEKTSVNQCEKWSHIFINLLEDIPVVCEIYVICYFL